MNSFVTSDSPSAQNHFRGFTLHEIRLRRAFILMKEQIDRDEITLKARSIMQSAGGQIARFSPRSGVVAKIAGSLDYFDYAYIAYTLGSKVFKLIKRVRTRKKK